MEADFRGSLPGSRLLALVVLIGAIPISAAGEAPPGWSDPAQVTQLGPWVWDENPSLIYDAPNATFWMAYESLRVYAQWEIWLTNSIDGLTWSQPLRVTNNTSSKGAPSLLRDGNGTFWIAFRLSISSPCSDIWLANSTNGMTWATNLSINESTAKRVTNCLANLFPSLLQNSTGQYILVWRSNILNANGDIFFSSSSDGKTWSPQKNLTNNTNRNDWPEVFQDANGVHWVIWTCGVAAADRNDDICIINSTDTSVWTSPSRIITQSNHY